MYRTKFNAKWQNQNEITQRIWLWMYQEQFCQHIHYFPGKQWLAIDPTWPALKVNNTCGFDISWSVWIFFFFFFNVDQIWYENDKNETILHGEYCYEIYTDLSSEKAHQPRKYCFLAGQIINLVSMKQAFCSGFSQKEYSLCDVLSIGSVCIYIEVFSFKLRAAWSDRLENYILGCTRI